LSLYPQERNPETYTYSQSISNSGDTINDQSHIFTTSFVLSINNGHLHIILEILDPRKI